MRMVNIAGTDLQVSSCCLGGMTWGAQNSEADAAEQLSMAWDCGINFVDTAEAYPVPIARATSGQTDRAIAKWMKATKQSRDSVVISTKVRCLDCQPCASLPVGHCWALCRRA